MVFPVRRGPGEVPSSTWLDRGDVDGPAQLERAHHTVSGLQGPRVNVTYRWITQHAASCPLAGVVVVFFQHVRKVWSSHVPVCWERRK